MSEAKGVQFSPMLSVISTDGNPRNPPDGTYVFDAMAAHAAKADREELERLRDRMKDLETILSRLAEQAERDARLATHRAEAAEAALRELSASAVQRVQELERERDAALARVQELETWTRSVATRLAGCERWDGSFEEQRFVGCSSHRSDDPNEWCIGCEAQALVEGRGSSYYAPTRQECPHREVCPDFPTCRTKDVVEPTHTARLPAGCACGGEGWCDACQIRWR